MENQKISVENADTAASQTDPTGIDEIAPAPGVGNEESATTGPKVDEKSRAEEPPPRTREELEKEVDELVRMTGECYLSVEFHKKNLEQFVLRSLYLNREVLRRNKIDEEAAGAKLKKAQEKRSRKHAALRSESDNE